MRQILISLLILIGIPNLCFAAPCYGTKMPQKRQLFCGLQTHVVLKRYLEKEYGKMRSRQNFLLLSYGISDWFSLDLKGGAGNIKQHPVGSDEIDYPTYMAGGYGFRVRLYEYDKTKMVFGFQHISVHPDSIDLSGIKHKAVLDDWQFSMLASRKFSKITPYIGTRWSRMDHIHWINTNRKRERSDLTKSIGLIIGIEIPMNDKLWWNIEGNFFDVEAFAISLNFSF